MNPNQALWENGDFARIASDVVGVDIARNLGISIRARRPRCFRIIDRCINACGRHAFFLIHLSRG